MKTITNELKKIWNIKILGIITLLCVLYFLLFRNTWITSYRSGTWFNTIDIAHHLTKMYGTTLEHGDFLDFLSYRNIIIAELDTAIASSPTFTYAGIYSFQDYEVFREDFNQRYPTLTELERETYSAILNEWFIIDGEHIGDTHTGRFAANNEHAVIDLTGILLQNHHSLGLAYSRLISYDRVVALYNANILGLLE